MNEGILRSLSEGGYASEGSARRSVWKGATGGLLRRSSYGYEGWISPWGSTELMLQGSRQDRELYVLLTVLLQSGEPKLVRAAEASLRSLVKQAR